METGVAVTVQSGVAVQRPTAIKFIFLPAKGIAEGSSPVSFLFDTYMLALRHLLPTAPPRLSSRILHMTSG